MPSQVGRGSCPCSPCRSVADHGQKNPVLIVNAFGAHPCKSDDLVCSSYTNALHVGSALCTWWLASQCQGWRSPWTNSCYNVGVEDTVNENILHFRRLNTNQGLDSRCNLAVCRGTSAKSQDCIGWSGLHADEKEADKREQLKICVESVQ